MLRRRLETIVLVKLLGLVIESVYQQGPDSGILRDGNGPLDCVLQQGCPQFDALRTPINRKPGKHHDWNGIWHVSAHWAGCQLMRDRAGSHCVISVNTAMLIRHHKGAAGASQLIGQRAALEPLVEHWFATLKFIQPMTDRERNRPI